MTVTNQDAIWEYFQNEAPESFAGSASRAAYLLRFVGRTGRVLNVGAGAGTFEEAAAARGLEVSSLDPSPKTIERLRQRLGLGDRARVGYGQSIPFPDGAFDVVVLSEVLEHLPDDVLQATLAEAARVLRKGGRLLGTVPARENLADQRVVCPDCGKRFHRWGHVQSFDVPRVRALLGVRFAEARAWDRPFANAAALNWKGKTLALARRLLHLLGVHGQQETIVFIATRP